MLFSGSVKSYKCAECSSAFSAVTPTSFFPIMFVIIAAAMIWAGNISEFFELKSAGLLIALFTGAALSIGSFCLTFVLLDRAFYGWEKSGKCPRCGGDLKGAAGGFTDGGLPGLHEILLYVIVLIVPLGLAFIIH